MIYTRWVLFLLLLTGIFTNDLLAESSAVIHLGSQFQAQDTETDYSKADSEDQKAGLENLSWTPQSFSVELEAAENSDADFLVRFPSPISSKHPENDRACLEWYAARDEAGQFLNRPAIVVVHESGRSMPVGRLFARTLNRRAYHTFLLHLPSYGKRSWGTKPTPEELLVLIRQAIMDVRRAYDAVKSIPIVNPNCIALQGTSLGGLVNATVAGVDCQYDAVFLMLAGGDFMSIIANGQKDAAKMRKELEKANIDPKILQPVIHQIEPNRFASGVQAEKVWLYSGKYDQVIPLENAISFAKAANLTPTHHILMPANHYSGIIYIPAIMQHIHEQMEAVMKSNSLPNQQ
ncbi:hypothetical protein [Rubinisphaera sp.]|uniref:hypothetical protein n=1 Tax=Rubinisphaera sp. TaxID=2024857 RepID=UPI000C0D413D|nr:hypothetical protein [Rubinisphaera sp.]MBV07946.1 hypothetical protein [Rubinisphaera sp.]HCS50770.1 hypothetical protein [Planctomycetaceae bacterium]